MVERWTRERRLEHTRTLLLDAAEEVFAEKGFTPATLDDIASAAGYTKGAIYKHFGTKEDLFLAVSDRYWRRYFDNFAEVLATTSEVGAHELDAGGRRRVAAVGENVNEDAVDLPPLRQLQQREEVADVAVDAAVGDQAHHVQRP